MRKRNVEINIISAEGLKLSSPFGRPHSYAVIWVHPKKKFYTHVDQEGGSNPVWNHKLVMSIDSHTLEHAEGKFTVEIFHRGHVHDKMVGSVEIPFKELPHEARHNHEIPSEIQYMAFEIRRPSGKNKGILNLSIQLREQLHHSCSSSSSSSSDSDDEPRPRSRTEETLAQPAGYPPAYPYPPAYSTAPAYAPQGYPSPSPVYAPPPPAYSYPASVPPEYHNSYSSGRQSGHSNLALGAGIAAGALGGLVLGEVVEDIAENAAYGDDDF